MTEQQVESFKGFNLDDVNPPERKQHQMTMEDVASTYGASLFFKRWAAYVIDFVFLGSLLAGLFLFEHNKTASSWLLISWLALICAYFLFLEGLTGYTLGKFVLRIQVVKRDGKPPGIVKSLIRSFMRLIEANPILIGALPAGVAVLASRKKQRLGDMLADTFVVNVRDLFEVSKRKNIVLLITFSISAVVAMLFVFFGIRAIASDSAVAAEKKFRTNDGLFQITATEDWIHDYKFDADRETGLAIKDKREQRLLYINSYKRSELATTYTLDTYVEEIKEQFPAKVSVSSERRVTLKNGDPAMELIMKEDNSTYIYTVVGTQDYYHHVIAGVVNYKYATYKDELHKIVASFRPAYGN
ncbi:RDD family protein [Paenibacillus sp. 481]|uniref:RDD family protein n=1 Tax=Paenibacillus sp. 481 TaxID=2835869 RepID=UPI001E623E8F|nr:RDD family protein [Paenibacillus sp. 481]UHA74579.1 RDD family protein [Paenibacillus sp. 481]